MDRPGTHRQSDLNGKIELLSGHWSKTATELARSRRISSSFGAMLERC